MKNYLLLLFVFVYLQSSAQSTIKTLVDSLASIYLNGSPGVLIIGINDDGKEYIFTYGETEKGNNKKPDKNSIFEIGNITETFTCILLADCSMKGIMQIDDRLQKYLPVDVPSPVYQPLICKPAEKPPEPAYTNPEDVTMKIRFTPYACSPDSTYEPQPILLCYLATHTSGLPDRPGNFYSKVKTNPYADYSTEDLYRFLRQYRLEKPIGFDFRHSDLGIALLGKSISLKMKKEYETILKETLLDGMNLNDTRIILSDEQHVRYLEGYNEKGEKVNKWTYNLFAPAGGLHSSATDMMKFLSLNISKKKNQYSNLLDFTHNSRIQPGGIFSDDMEVALGWKIRPDGNESSRVVWQSGLTGGFASYIGFIETSHKGVMILSSVSKDVNEVGSYLLREMDKEKNSSEGNLNKH